MEVTKLHENSQAEVIVLMIQDTTPPSCSQVRRYSHSIVTPHCSQLFLSTHRHNYIINALLSQQFDPFPLTHTDYHFAGGQLYSGTVADFSGSDALVIRDQLRTEQYNLKHLNRPNFVGSVEDEDYVYFFFREEAVEFMNCGKV